MTQGALLAIVFAIVVTALLIKPIITWRRKTCDTHTAASSERRLRDALASLEQYKFALDQHAIVAVTDAAGRITEVNDQFCRISGYQRDELIGQTHKLVNSGRHPRAFFVEMWRTVSRGEVWREEICNRAKDGSLYWVDTTIVPLLGPDGRPQRYIAIRADVTARRRALQALEESERRFQMIADSAPALIWMADDDNGGTYFNRSWLAYTGRNLGQELAEGWLESIHPDDLPERVRVYRVAAGTRASVTLEYRLRAADGTYRWFLENALPRFRAEGAFEGYIGVCIDITSRKVAEAERRQLIEQMTEARQAAESASQAKSQFLANMSHEIRTPMTAILGHAELLAESSPDDPEWGDRTQTIHRNGRHLLAIINDILDLSKIEAGELAIESKPVSLATLIGEVMSLMCVRAEKKRIALDAEGMQTLPDIVKTDAQRLRQILMNLIGNAIKFTDVGSVRLVASAASRDAEAGATVLRFEVHDTGIGISDEDFKALFRPFGQADVSSTRRHGGTGLGLAISRHLARAMGGDIVAHSTRGRGSCFVVSLPVQVANVGETMGTSISRGSDSTSAEFVAAGPTEWCGRVLLAEDGLDNQRLFTHILRKAGLEVRVVENGREAVDHVLAAERDDAGDRPFDVVLMDMQMPEMDGYAATRHLRDAGFHKPIIALTAHAMAGDRDTCLAAGCTAYATKPITRQALVRLVTDAMAGVPTDPGAGI